MEIRISPKSIKRIKENIPETYMTAWALLNWGLSTAPGDFLLIRGATSTLGQACSIPGRQAGLSVIATTRSATILFLTHSVRCVYVGLFVLNNEANGKIVVTV